MPDQNRGGFMGLTDKDYIEELGLDPSLEGQPGINRAIVQAIREQTKQAYMEDGMSEAMAEKMARKQVK